MIRVKLGWSMSPAPPPLSLFSFAPARICYKNAFRGDGDERILEAECGRLGEISIHFYERPIRSLGGRVFFFAKFGGTYTAALVKEWLALAFFFVKF